MFKSANRNQAEGTLDRIGGRVLEIWGKLTGKKSATVKGKAAGGRGRFRQTTASTKRTGESASRRVGGRSR